MSIDIIKDIAWADWAGTLFSALAFIYLYKQVKLQKQQVDEQNSYNRSMAAFELIKIRAKEMDEKYSDILSSILNKDSKITLYAMRSMQDSCFRFVASVYNNIENIDNKNIKRVFETYVFESFILNDYHAFLFIHEAIHNGCFEYLEPLIINELSNCIYTDSELRSIASIFVEFNIHMKKWVSDYIQRILT